MQFKTLLSAAVLATTSWAIQFTSFPPAGLQVGQTVNLTWSGAAANTPISILLRSGNAANLQTVQTITSSATGNSFQWTPATTLPDGATYALQIVQGEDFNYTPQFSIQGGTAASVSASQSSLLASLSSSAASALSSVSSQASSISSSISASSAMITSSASMSRAASTSTSSSARPTTSGATSTTNAAGTNVQSPLALILGAVAAMCYFQ